MQIYNLQFTIYNRQPQFDNYFIGILVKIENWNLKINSIKVLK